MDHEQKKQIKYNKLYMNIAKLISQQSYAKRNKVGALLIKDGNIISFGWNGQPASKNNGKNTNFKNICEDNDGNTLPTVLHAEHNVITKAAKTGISINNSILFVTLSPCANCALLLIQSGIKSVYYLDEYRKLDGVKILKDAGILVECIKEIM